MINASRAFFLGVVSGVTLALASLPAMAGQGFMSPDAAAKVAGQDAGTTLPSEYFSEGAHVANGASLRNASEATIWLRGLPADASSQT
jgi:hypothetical protein